MSTNNKVSVGQLIHQVMGVMLNAHNKGMPDDELFSAAITALVVLAKAAGHDDVLPKVLEMAIKDIRMEEVTATKH